MVCLLSIGLSAVYWFVYCLLECLPSIGLSTAYWFVYCLPGIDLSTVYWFVYCLHPLLMMPIPREGISLLGMAAALSGRSTRQFIQGEPPPPPPAWRAYRVSVCVLSHSCLKNTFREKLCACVCFVIRGILLVLGMTPRGV